MDLFLADCHQKSLLFLFASDTVPNYASPMLSLASIIGYYPLPETNKSKVVSIFCRLVFGVRILRKQNKESRQTNLDSANYHRHCMM